MTYFTSQIRFFLTYIEINPPPSPQSVDVILLISLHNHGLE